MKYTKFLSSVLVVSSLLLLAGCGGKQASGEVSHNKDIPDGAVYEVCQDSIGDRYEKVEDSQKMPPLKHLDRYTYGDFRYSYHEQDGGWNVELPRDEEDEEICKERDFGVILSYINGKPVVKMNMTFSGCDDLVDASSIVIPSTVKELTRTFGRCENLEKAPVIPGTVEDLFCTFENCKKLTGEITIDCDAKVTGTFSGTKEPIKLVGKASEATKKELAETQTDFPDKCTITY